MPFVISFSGSIFPTRWRRLRLWSVGAWLAAATLGFADTPWAADSLAGIDESWRHYRSPNFELFSGNGERDSRNLLRNLELLQATGMNWLKLTERERLEVTVYYFRRRADFRAYGMDALGKSASAGGYYHAWPDRAVIVLGPTADRDQARHAIFHEYIHHLLRVARLDPPVWFGEGMAELFATVQEAGSEIEIGRPYDAAVEVLRTDDLLPLETLFAVDHESSLYGADAHTGVFYAESWALLHYWHFGRSAPASAAVARFLNVAASRQKLAAVDLRALFRECFGMDYPEMQRRLEEYLRIGNYRVDRRPLPTIDSPQPDSCD